LNLVNALNRFLPSAGRRTGRIILLSYLASAGMGVIVSLVFLAGISLWAPSLAFLTSTPSFVVVFMLSTIAWGIFALQDSALTGIRQAVWVPVENILFSIAKIILLVAFASLIPAYGILASWLAPLGIALVLVNILLFRRLIPRHVEQARERGEPVQARQVAGYVAGDYAGSLFWMAAAHLQPIIITQLAGAESNAYFYLGWQIAYALYLVSRNMGMSLIAEAAADPVKLNEYSFRVLKQSFRMLVPVVLVIFVGAPWILRLFGREYASEGATLLRLLSLSAIPQIIVALHLSIARVQRDVKTLIFTQASLSIMVLGMIYLFIGRFGITGIGLAWLIAQSLLAAVLIVTRLRIVLLSHLNLNLPLHVLGMLRSLKRRGQDRQQVRRVNAITPQIFQHSDASRTGALPETWHAQQVVRTVSDITVVTLGEDGQPPEALLKLANSDKAVTSLNSQKQMLNRLRSRTGLDGFGTLLPELLAEGQANDQYYVLERMLPGVDARMVIGNPEVRTRFLTNAAEAIGELHQRTARTVQVNPKLLRQWVDDRMRLVREIKAPHSPLHPYDQGIEKLSEELYQSLSGKTVPVSWIHGDYTPGNILVTPDGSKVTGIVDWDLAAEDLPMIDLVQLLLATRLEVRKRELGDIIRGLLREEDTWTAEEKQLLEKAQTRLLGDPLDMRTLLLLTWLRHVASTLSKSKRYTRNWLWVTKNVEMVLGSL
jgi:Ser/Thr protein kinase RdoA (MazF antagonist)/O-antigen/teichoic acid export membrane protein